MNYKKNYLFAFLFISSLTIHKQLMPVLSINQYKPDSFFQKPYYTQDNFATISSIFSVGSASQAYNNQGKKVSYLEQFQPEKLFNRFIDGSLPSDHPEIFGQAILSGQLHVKELIIACCKHLNRGFFIEAATVIQDILTDNITLNFIPENQSPTDLQLQSLATLQRSIPKKIDKSGMFTTAIYAGYSKTLSHFTHLDFIDITIKTGFMSPESMLKTQQTILNMPGNLNQSFGYPIITTASIGLLDWLTIGSNESIVLWQKATTFIPMNTQIGNNILMPDSGIATIKRDPLLSATLYLEADHFYHGLSGIIGYCYNKQCAYTIRPYDQEKFPIYAVNQAAQVQAWSVGSLYMELSIDFARDLHPNAPIISIYANIPVAGKLYPKTNIAGGACSLQISYIF